MKSKFKKDGFVWYKEHCNVCDVEITYKRGDKPKKCPNPECKSNTDSSFPKGIFDKPKTEIELFLLQEQYLAKIDQGLFALYAEEIQLPEDERNQEIIKKHESNMDRKLLEKMYMLVIDYTGSLLKKRMKGKCFFMDPEELQDKIFQASFFWYEQFTQKPGFRIDGSWAGQLNFKITQALYQYKEDEQFDSLDRIITDSSSSNQTSLLDMKESFNFEHAFINKDIEDVYNDYTEVFTETKKILKDLIKKIKETSLDKYDGYRRSLLALNAFNLFVLKKEDRLNKLFALYGNEVKSDLENIKLVIRRYWRRVLEN